MRCSPNKSDEISERIAHAPRLTQPGQPENLPLTPPVQQVWACCAMRRRAAVTPTKPAKEHRTFAPNLKKWFRCVLHCGKRSARAIEMAIDEQENDEDAAEHDLASRLADLHCGQEAG